MPVVDLPAMPEIPMRPGVTGRWLSGARHGASGTSVLRNWVEPGVAIPRHLHAYEEIVLIEQGRMWFDIDGTRHEAQAGQTVIIPPRAVHAWGTFDEKAQVLFVWPTSDPFAPGNSTYLDGPPPAT
jgi:quercetin dioxygenase-like cupin family protein